MPEGQIIEAAEATRQFPRYRIPAFIEINGKRYRLRDWSLGGCAIENPSEELLNGKYFKAAFICPFEEFELVIKDINLQPLERRNGILAARFGALRPEQIALFKEIINAYLEGTIEILPEKFINVIKREDLRAAVEARRPVPPPETKLKILKQIFIFSLLCLSFLVLISFLLVSLKERVFTVRAVSATIEGKVYFLRSPVTGVFEPVTDKKPGEMIEKGEVIGFVKSPSLGSVLVKSSLEGQLLRWGRSLPVVREGDPILYVLPPRGSLYVRAIVLHEEAEHLQIGQQVLIRDTRGNTFRGEIKEILSGEGIYSQALSLDLRPLARAPNYDFLIILPQAHFSPSRIGEAVQVKISVVPSSLKNFYQKMERILQIPLK